MNKHWGETLIFLCFVIVAAALWYGHAMTSVRTEVVPIHVQYTGMDPLVSFKDTLPSTLSVEVHDAGQRLKTYYRDQPTLTLNLHTLTTEEQGTLDIPEEQVRSSVTALLQGTSKLLTISPAAIHGTYYRQESKEVTVILRANITPTEEYQFAVQPSLYEPTIQVYGDPKVLQQIDTIYTHPYTFTGLKDTLSDWVRLDLPKGVRAKLEEVAFTAITERFTEKVFTLPISCKLPDSTMTLRLFPAEAAVTVRCAIRDFNEAEASDIVLECDFPQTPKERLVVKAKTNDPVVHVVRIQPSQVEYILEQQ